MGTDWQEPVAPDDGRNAKKEDELFLMMLHVGWKPDIHRQTGSQGQAEILILKEGNTCEGEKDLGVILIKVATCALDERVRSEGYTEKDEGVRQIL